MDTDFNTQAIELLGADTPGVIADALQEAYERGRADTLDKFVEEKEYALLKFFGDDAPEWLVSTGWTAAP